MSKQQCIIILFSIHYVIKAEKVLQAGKLEHEVIPVPRTISSDCGMAIRFPCRQLASVRTLLARHHISIARIYQADRSGTYKEIEHDPIEQHPAGQTG